MVSQNPNLTPRDALVVRYVTRFKQLSAQQIRALVFEESANNTPADRALKRLTDSDVLARIERSRLVGGSRGGSGQYVYQLGRRGFYMFSAGRYTPSRAINFHALGIADAFLALRQMERDGLIRMAGMATEPDCWLEVAGVDLRPDLRADFDVLSTGRRHLWWLEIDMGTEGQKQLRGKLESYNRAWQFADTAVLPVFPRVHWVAVDQERANELAWLVSEMPEDARELFKVSTFDQLPASLLS